MADPSTRREAREIVSRTLKEYGTLLVLLLVLYGAPCAYAVLHCACESQLRHRMSTAANAGRVAEADNVDSDEDVPTLRDDEDHVLSELPGDGKACKSAAQNGAQAVLQRWLDSDCL